MVMEINARGLRVGWDRRAGTDVEDTSRTLWEEQGLRKEKERLTDVSSQETPAKYQRTMFSHVASLQLQHRPVREGGPLNIILPPILNPDICSPLPIIMPIQQNCE